MNTNEWMDSLTGGATAKDVARKAGIPERTLQHQAHSGKLSLENAVKISTAYGRHPLRTLIDLGVIDAAWEQVPDVQAALKIATNEELTGEIMERLELVEHDPIYDVPVDQLAERRKTRSVTPTTAGETYGDLQDGAETTPSVQGDWDGEMPEDAVADSSPEEGGTPDDFES